MFFKGIFSREFQDNASEKEALNGDNSLQAPSCFAGQTVREDGLAWLRPAPVSARRSFPGGSQTFTPTDSLLSRPEQHDGLSPQMPARHTRATVNPEH